MSICNIKYSGEKTMLPPKIYNMMSFTVLLQLNISIYFIYILIYIIHIYNRESPKHSAQGFWKLHFN